MSGSHRKSKSARMQLARASQRTKRSRHAGDCMCFTCTQRVLHVNRAPDAVRARTAYHAAPYIGVHEYSNGALHADAFYIDDPDGDE